jgi:dTDP-4-amino-4,6-dideoxygalactose transaminase
MTRENDEQAVIDALRSGVWNRRAGSTVDTFETAFAKWSGAKGCVATSSGTAALYTSLNALTVGPGDEVIVPPYTFVATINVVLRQFALPVFSDTDRETFQMDVSTVQSKITPRTKAIIPVHLGGAPADMDRVAEVARMHKLAVLEDACQAWDAAWRGRNVGNHGRMGCFSFQASKNLNTGEGGAIISNDEALLESCFAFHNNGRGKKSNEFGYHTSGSNHRMTSFQAAILLSQMTRLDEQQQLRRANSDYLSSLLREIPGIAPARMHVGATRNACHLYMFRYDPARFAGLPRAGFLRAMRAEGISVSPGYEPLNTQPFLKAAFEQPVYRKLYGDQRLAQWHEQNQCPANDKLCQEGCWLTQNTMLAGRGAMDQIAEAVRRIQSHAGEIHKRLAQG